jgi:PilZ domain
MTTLLPPREAVVIAKSPRSDRRQTTRHPSHHASLVRRSDAGNAPARAARVCDLSSEGIGFICAMAYPLGTPVLIAPVGGGGAAKLDAVVVRCEPISGGWLHGCKLTDRLDEEQMSDWLVASTV